MNTRKLGTIVGASGYVGKHLANALHRAGWDLYLPTRGDPALFSEDLGIVFYCAGLTANFRNLPFETVEAHVSHLAEILKRARFKSLIYLSSTRVYQGSERTSESEALLVCPSVSGDLYNLSKLMGESLCLNSGRDARIARLSNVYGNEMSSRNFLGDLISEARQTGQVRFRSSPSSSKDFVHIEDVVRALPELAMNPELAGITNVASGINISNRELAVAFEKFGVRCSFEPQAEEIVFPIIDTSKIKRVLKTSSSDLLNDLPILYQRNGECT